MTIDALIAPAADPPNGRPPTSAEDRPMRADARRNRERVLVAARAVFAETGAEAQMDDVAREAGVGVGTVYRHFPTKEALMGELVRQKFALFVAEARAALAIEADPFAVIADLLRSNAEHMALDAATRYAMGAGMEVWDAAAAEHDELNRIFTVLIARAQRAGAVRADLTVADIPMIMCGVSSSMSRDFDWRRHLELVLDGIKARDQKLPAAREPAVARSGSEKAAKISPARIRRADARG